MLKNKVFRSFRDIFFGRSLLLAIGVCFLLYGCASTKLPHVYLVEGKEYKNFDSLNDEDALKAVVMTYNVPVEGKAEETAKIITLQEQMEKLRKRKSVYIVSSGVFEMIVFGKIDLSLWPEEDLIDTYNELRKTAAMSTRFEALKEEENAKKIVYVVGMQGLVNELERRTNKKQAWQIASQLLAAALSVAVSII